MTIEARITCQPREKKTRGYLKKMIREDWVPGIIYGKKQTPVPVFLGRRELSRAFSEYGTRGLFNLEMQGNTAALPVLVRDLQHHPINGQVTHIDFLLVDMYQKITSSVLVQIEGEEELRGNVAILQVAAKEIQVTCLPDRLPESFVLNVADLDVGDKVTVADIPVPVGVEILDEPLMLIATVLAPSRPLGEPEDQDTNREDTENQSPQD